jgi:hypothetical protein
MNPQSRQRKTATLSKTVRHQLNSYAIAASAAGVGALALAQPAEAKIVYTPAHITVPTNTVLPLDLNHDGISDLSFTIASLADSSFLLAYNLGTNGVVGDAQNQFNQFASALRPGQHIGAKRKFLTGKTDKLWGDWFSSGGGGSEGKWKNEERYLGVKFSIKGEIHYGWVRLRVSVPSRIDAIITGYAYETISNKPIIAGETEGSASDASLAGPAPKAPQPASLCMLALGAQGLSMWRKEYAAATM